MNYSKQDSTEDDTFDKLRYHTPQEAWMLIHEWIREYLSSGKLLDTLDWMKFYLDRDMYVRSLGHNFEDLAEMFA